MNRQQTVCEMNETPRTASERKRQAILDAARDTFLSSGFGAVSMDSIAAAAGVSKQTVYNHFGSKEELFAAIIRDRCQRMVGALNRIRQDNGKPEQVLRGLAEHFVSKLLGNESICIYRAVMAEVSRFPELGRIFYDSGPANAIQALANYLEEQHAAGTLYVPRPRIAAEQFFAMLNGQLRMRALLGVGGLPDKKEIREHVDGAVEAMMHLWAPRPA